MDSLDELYRQAEYVVSDRGAQFAFRVGETSAALETTLRAAGHDRWAFVSAFNPQSTPATAEENALRHDQLLELLRRDGFDHLLGYGHSPDGDWEPETSVLILGIDPAAAIEIGRRFGQNAILTGRIGSPAELVWCD